MPATFNPYNAVEPYVTGRTPRGRHDVGPDGLPRHPLRLPPGQCWIWRCSEPSDSGLCGPHRASIEAEDASDAAGQHAEALGERRARYAQKMTPEYRAAEAERQRKRRAQKRAAA